MLKNFSGQILLSDKDKLKNPSRIIKKLTKYSIFILRSQHNLNLSKLKELRLLCAKLKIYFFVQELSLAYLLKADGISIKEQHISRPRFKIKKKFLTIASCHNQRAAKIAEKNHDNFILYSPIFKTTSHKDNKYLGLTKFNRQTRFLNINIIALGGINNENIMLLKNLNIIGFAAIDYFSKLN